MKCRPAAAWSADGCAGSNSRHGRTEFLHPEAVRHSLLLPLRCNGRDSACRFHRWQESVLREYCLAE